MVTFSFDSTNIVPATEYSLIPDGLYKAIIIDSDVKSTKDKTGKYIALTFQLTYGQYKDRLVFSNINVENKNQQAVDIGLSQLSAICHAVNVIKTNDTVQLHGKELVIKIASEKRDGYNERNIIKAYLPIKDDFVNNTKKTVETDLNDDIPF